MSDEYKFYCSACKYDHAGECVASEAAPPPGADHNWIQFPVDDLSIPFACSQCGRPAGVTLVASAFAGGKVRELLVAGPCPGKIR